ncbi:MAG: hypothetical protein U1C74_21635 [Phenylobacterium sp.]|nr:hypothetical protein [Phenylobacterium sp.]
MTETPTTPADRILARFGAGRIAAWTGRHRSRVHAWAWPTTKGGTGGVVPPRLRQAIIDGAHRELGETVTHADFELQPGETYQFGEAA